MQRMSALISQESSKFPKQSFTRFPVVQYNQIP